MLALPYVAPLRTPFTMPIPQPDIHPAQTKRLLRRAFFACLMSLLGAIVCTIFGLLFLIYRGPGLLVATAGALIHTPRLSLKLKGLALLLLVPLAMLAALLLLPVLSTYGLMAGFAEAYACPELATLHKLVDQAHNLLRQTRDDYLSRLTTTRSALQTDEVPFDIPLGKLLPALIAGVAGALIFLLSLALYLAVMSLPALCRWDYLWFSKSAQPLLIRIALLLVSPLCALLFVGLLPVTGMIYGAVICARRHYLSGWLGSLTELQQTLTSGHQQFIRYLF